MNLFVLFLLELVAEVKLEDDALVQIRIEEYLLYTKLLSNLMWTLLNTNLTIFMIKLLELVLADTLVLLSQGE